MNLASGNIHPVWGYDADDVVCVINHEEKKIHVGEIVSVDLKEDEADPEVVPDINIRWWISRPPKKLFVPFSQSDQASENTDPYSELQLSDRILQAGDSVTHLHQQNKRGIVLSMDRKCDIEIIDRNQYICNVDCRKLMTNPRSDPPRRVLYKGWIGLATVKASSVILRFHDGARVLCPASVVGDFEVMTHSHRNGQDDPFTSHDMIIEGMVFQGDLHAIKTCNKSKFLTSTPANNALLLSVLPKNVEAELTVERVITKGVVVDWLWNMIGSNEIKDRPPRIFCNKEVNDLTYIDRLEDVWYWGCRYDTLWTYEVEEGNVVIDNNVSSLDREHLFYQLYANENIKFGDVDGFYQAVDAGVSQHELEVDSSLFRYTVKNPDSLMDVTKPESHSASKKITKKLEDFVSGPLRDRLKRARKARLNSSEGDSSTAREIYVSETLEGHSWDSKKKLVPGQKVPVCVIRTISTADILWADGTVEHGLPMSSFGFELFEDYMQAPQLMPGDLILPPTAPIAVGPALQQTDWSHGYGIVLTYSSESRVCTVRWFDVAPDRRSAYPSTADLPTELGTWGLQRLESIARGLDRNTGLIFWINENSDCAEGASGDNIRVGLLKDIDNQTGELVIQEYTGEQQIIRLFPCWPGIIPFTNILTENEMIKLANNDSLEFDSMVDDEDGSEASDDEDANIENDESMDDDADDDSNGDPSSPPTDVQLPSGDARNAPDWQEWETLRVDNIEMPGSESALDISELYEDFREHCLGVASLFTDTSRINPMGLTFGFMELMDLGPIVVRMYRMTKDMRFHSAAAKLKRFGSLWCRQIITDVCQPLLRRAWLPADERSHTQEEIHQILGKLMTLTAEAASSIRNTVETLSVNYSRNFLINQVTPEVFFFPNVQPQGEMNSNSAPSEINTVSEGFNEQASSTATENEDTMGATATAEEEKLPSVSFISEDEFRLGHCFFNESHSPSRAFLKAWKSDINLLQSSLPDGIYVKACESRMDLLSFMLIGPEETPFEDAVFHFDVGLGSDYPNKPPKVFFHSYTKERLNPNLYPDGKVCLSLLGTWEGTKEGEMWNPHLSNLLQIILSIQGLILNAEPFMNEPGHEKAQEKQRTHYIRLYNEEVVLLGTNFTSNLLSRPPSMFLPEIKQHFKRNGEKYIRRLREWCKSEEEMLPELKPKFALLPVTRGFKLSMPLYIIALKEKIDAIVLP